MPKTVKQSKVLIAPLAAIALSASLPAFALAGPAAATAPLSARYHNHVLCEAYAIRLGAYMAKIGNSNGESVADNAQQGFERQATAIAVAAGQNSDIVYKDLVDVQQTIDVKTKALSESEQKAFFDELDDFCTTALTQNTMPDIAFWPLAEM